METSKTEQVKTLVNASVDSENVYVNENAGLFLPIVTCTSTRRLILQSCVTASNSSASSSAQTNSFFLLAATRLRGKSLNANRLRACELLSRENQAGTAPPQCKRIQNIRF